ncbi:unnamed protein product [Closterium sp. NIES-54]
MHPLLTVEKHPKCAELIEKLNGIKVELDACFRQEKVERRTVNLKASKEFRERLREQKAADEAAGVPRWTETLRQQEGSQS